jgi:hypothetical protein
MRTGSRPAQDSEADECSRLEDTLSRLVSSLLEEPPVCSKEAGVSPLQWLGPDPAAAADVIEGIPLAAPPGLLIAPEAPPLPSFVAAQRRPPPPPAIRPLSQQDSGGGSVLTVSAFEEMLLLQQQPSRQQQQQPKEPETSSTLPPEQQPAPCGSRAPLTVMLRNIPNKYTADMLVDRLFDCGFRGFIDFLYLPIDFKNRCNVGYAFVSFRDPAACANFVSQFHGASSVDMLPGFNSKKVCQVSPAHCQGCSENVRRLQASPVMVELAKNPEWLPRLFDEKGQPAEFPVPSARNQRAQGPEKPAGRQRHSVRDSGRALKAAH